MLSVFFPWLLLAALPLLPAGGGERRQEPPSGEPQALVDLASREGVELVKGAWRYHDARLVEVDFRDPGPDRKPSGPPNRTFDVEPRAGAANFDDSAWEVLDPTTLDQRRASGRVCFNWYRFAVTIPERVGDFDPTGATVVFEIVVDDYAEVWVDGELPREIGQSGGSLIRGWNAPNRLVIGENVRSGDRIQLAVFGINGPISDPPPNFIWVRSAKLEFHQEPRAVLARPPAAQSARLERFDPRFDELVPPGAAVEAIATGQRWVEGPLWIPERRALLFSDIPANQVLEWRPGASPRVFLERSGWSGEAAAFAGREPGSNGLCLDPRGRLVLCEHGNRRITRLEEDGSRTVLADRYRGKRLNSPNDAIHDSQGNLYFTDPPFGLPETFEDPAKELPWSGVYRLRPSGELTLLVDELAAPNGLALSPDERTLYVSNADPGRPVWMAYELRGDGAAGAGRLFCDAGRWTATRRGLPDGLKVDRRGNLYAAGPEGIYVFAPDGTHLGTIFLGDLTSNCAFGEDGAALYVTANTAVYRIALARLSESRPPAGS